jgi:predicted nuclease with TOPRIM domain
MYHVDRNDAVSVKSILSELEPEKELAENFSHLDLSSDELKKELDDMCRKLSGLDVS